MTLLAKRYASALLLAATGQSAVDAVGTDLQALHGLLQDETLRALLASPELHAADRQRLVARLGAGRNPLVQNLLLVAERRRRLPMLADLYPEYRALVMAERGEVEGVVETPRPLTADAEQRLTGLAARLAGRKVALSVRVRPELLGGARLRLGNVLYDGSVKSALEQLQQKLLQASI